MSPAPLSRDRAQRRAEALIFGLFDMRCVERTAQHLLDTFATEDDGYVRRTLETGLVIVYARPFTASRGLPPLKPAPFDNEHMRNVHEAYLAVRHAVYAHTDVTDLRQVIRSDQPDWLDQFVATGLQQVGETWSPPSPDLLEDVRALSVQNRMSFEAEVERLRRRLVADGTIEPPAEPAEREQPEGDVAGPDNESEDVG